MQEEAMPHAKALDSVTVFPQRVIGSTEVIEPERYRANVAVARQELATLRFLPVVAVRAVHDEKAFHPSEVSVAKFAFTVEIQLVYLMWSDERPARRVMADKGEIAVRRTSNDPMPFRISALFMKRGHMPNRFKEVP